MNWPHPSIIVEWCATMGTWPDIWYAVGFADAVQGFAFSSGGFDHHEQCDEAQSYRNGWRAGRASFPKEECLQGEHPNEDEPNGAMILRESYTGVTTPTYP